MPPEPSIPTVCESGRDRYRTPSPAPPPTRMCCRMPSLIIASGSPSRVLNSMMSPQYVPGSMQYFSSFQ